MITKLHHPASQWLSFLAFFPSMSTALSPHSQQFDALVESTDSNGLDRYAHLVAQMYVRGGMPKREAKRRAWAIAKKFVPVARNSRAHRAF